MAAILTILVGGFVAYLGFEFVNFARTPELRITDPPGNVNGYTELEITIRGVTEPNASVKVSNLPENPTVVADAEGKFEVVVGLLPGSNVMQLVASDPTTGRNSEMEERTILVVTDVAASPSAAPMALSLDQPAAERTVRGPVPIAGTAAPNAEVTVTAALVRAADADVRRHRCRRPAGVDPGAADPPAPDPLALTADASGAFSGELAPARRALGAHASRRATASRSRGASTSARERDCARRCGSTGASPTSRSRRTARRSRACRAASRPRRRVDLAANDELRIRAGNAGAVRLTINGIGIGAMGGSGDVVEWRITRRQKE